MTKNIGKFLFVIWVSVLGLPSAGLAMDNTGAVFSTPGILAPSASIKIAQIGLSTNDARRILRREGYREIQIIRSSFKNIHAEACFRGVRYQVKVRRLTSKVIQGDKIGGCRRPLGERAIIDKLNRSGLDRISLSKGRRGGYIAEACDYDRRVRLRVDAFGQITRRTDEGE